MNSRTLILQALFLLSLGCAPLRAQTPRTNDLPDNEDAATEITLMVDSNPVMLRADDDADLRIVSQGGKAKTMQLMKESDGTTALKTADGTLLAGFRFAPRKRLARAAGDRAYLGATLGEIGDVAASQLDLRSGDTTLILGVVSGQPAEKAGLQANDIITKIDGRTPASQVAIQEALAAHKPGDSITLQIMRKGHAQEVSVVLAARPMTAADRVAAEWEAVRRPYIAPNGEDGRLFIKRSAEAQEERKRATMAMEKAADSLRSENVPPRSDEVERKLKSSLERNANAAELDRFRDMEDARAAMEQAMEKRDQAADMRRQLELQLVEISKLRAALDSLSAEIKRLHDERTQEKK